MWPRRSRVWGWILIIPGAIFVIVGIFCSNTDNMVLAGIAEPYEVKGLLWGLGIGLPLIAVGCLINRRQAKGDIGLLENHQIATIHPDDPNSLMSPVIRLVVRR